MSEPGRHEADDGLPIFSKRLDDVMAAMIAGEAPNAGRFCGYCYTPLRKGSEECSHCGTSTSDYAAVTQIPREFGALYRRMRKRESLIVNSFAFAGLFLGVLIFTVLVAVAVYRYDQSLWMLGFATLVLIVGGRVLAGLLGGWIGDNIGYSYARRKLAIEWAAYSAAREASLGRSSSTARSDEAAGPAHAAPSTR